MPRRTIRKRCEGSLLKCCRYVPSSGMHTCLSALMRLANRLQSIVISAEAFSGLLLHFMAFQGTQDCVVLPEIMNMVNAAKPTV
ncbi:hypothetical protein MRX96_015180 [Rhipicephalus microplus]